MTLIMRHWTWGFVPVDQTPQKRRMRLTDRQRGAVLVTQGEGTGFLMLFVCETGHECETCVRNQLRYQVFD